MFNYLKKRLSSSAAGFTIAEATTVLAAAAILAGTVTPVMSDYINSARLSRAKNDLKVLGSAIHLYRVDTAESGFLQMGKAGLGQKDASSAVTMLVSNGDTPPLGPGGDPEWIAPVNGLSVDFFEDHLVTNSVGYATSADRTGGFAQPSQGGFNAPYAWRGPYVNGPIEGDPWGNRYASNVLYLSTFDANDVVILSAGPDEQINSAFTQDGLVAGGDDIIYTISGGR